MFTEKDLEILKEKNISLEKVNWQLLQFIDGVEPICLVKPATIAKGVVDLDNLEKYIKIFDDADVEVLKFVPASGAASRMFKELFEFNTKAEANPDINLGEYPAIKKFFDNIKRFAFFTELNERLTDQGGVERLITGKKYSVILSCLLNKSGMNYGGLPKGLLKFHFYAGAIARTPFEEHLEEGAKYANSKGGRVKLHFTVSPEHMEEFEAMRKKAVNKFEEMYNLTYEISFSIQKPSTDTLAVTPENEPFYDKNGEILFRPGGHGALIENLNEINQDLIFIKNIDNVVPEKRISNTVKFKKALAGYLLDIQKRVFTCIEELEKEAGEESVKEAENILNDIFCLTIAKPERLETDYVAHLIQWLNRPIRICGVVKNEGEPGGGPFLVKDENGICSPQIVESSQVNVHNAEQKSIFEASTHFNPVDLICAVKNYKGEKFNLTEYIDFSTCFISQKSNDGKNLKALELPGLWNGAMAKWNTVFIEVSMDTFNPVKSVNDLLREAHQ